jgi:hypothetical protein
MKPSSRRKTRMKRNIVITLAAVLFAGGAAAQGIALKTSPNLGASQATAGPAAASTRSNAAAYATTSSQGGSALGVGSQGQSLTVDSHAVYEGARTAAATAVAAPLASSNDTCMGSTSVAGSAVSFGFSAGTTWTDTNCVMLKNAREIWNMGFKGAALARLCMDDLNKEALEATGIACPQRRNAKQDVPVVEASGSQDTTYRN